MRSLLTVAHIAFWTTLASHSQAGACSSDVECKGDRICEAGKCVSPRPKETGTEAKSVPGPVPSKPNQSALPAGMDLPAAIRAFLSLKCPGGRIALRDKMLECTLGDRVLAVRDGVVGNFLGPSSPVALLSVDDSSMSHAEGNGFGIWMRGDSGTWRVGGKIDGVSAGWRWVGTTHLPNGTDVTLAQYFDGNHGELAGGIGWVVLSGSAGALSAQIEGLVSGCSNSGADVPEVKELNFSRPRLRDLNGDGILDVEIDLESLVERRDAEFNTIPGTKRSKKGTARFVMHEGRFVADPKNPKFDDACPEE